MREFLFDGGWFHQYSIALGERYVTFKAALNLLLQHGGLHIVETGSMR